MFRHAFESGSLFVNGQRLTVFFHERDLCFYAICPSGVLVKGDEPEQAIAGAVTFYDSAQGQHGVSVSAA